MGVLACMGELEHPQPVTQGDEPHDDREDEEHDPVDDHAPEEGEPCPVFILNAPCEKREDAEGDHADDADDDPLPEGVLGEERYSYEVHGLARENGGDTGIVQQEAHDDEEKPGDDAVSLCEDLPREVGQADAHHEQEDTESDQRPTPASSRRNVPKFMTPTAMTKSAMRPTQKAGHLRPASRAVPAMKASTSARIGRKIPKNRLNVMMYVYAFQAVKVK